MKTANRRQMTRDEFTVWFLNWRDAHTRAEEDGEPGFGNEDTLLDWLGSLDAFAELQAVAVMKGKVTSL